MTGRGRPKLPDGIARDVTMSVRLTLEERRRVSRASDRDGFESDSEWARHILLKSLKLDRKLLTPQQQVEAIVFAEDPPQAEILAGGLAVASEAILEPDVVTTRSLTIEKQPEQPPEAPVAELTKSEPDDNTVSPQIKKVRNIRRSVVHVVEPYRTRLLPKLPHPGAIYTRPVVGGKP